jgi:hypothetical protein
MQPAAGTACSWSCRTEWQCGYPSCTGPIDQMAICQGGTWQIPPTACDAGAD